MQNKQSAKNLTQWLSYIESLHPKSIAMGLDRVNGMIARLQLHPKFTIITVAGTNGKGSTCAMLAQIYQNAGYQVACYSSPHLLRYNERVRVNGLEASDAALCKAFEAVEAARCSANTPPIALTYFEVGTLAALWHFMQAGVDVAILEVGLGGRLDAVNAFEPDCAIVTSVDLDHQEFLGDTRELIGVEKAGIYRPSIAAICGDANPPNSLVAFAQQVQADFKCLDQHFDVALVDARHWRYSDGKVAYTLPLPALQGAYQLSNAACAITAVEALQARLPVSITAMDNAMRQVGLAGRFQTILNAPHVILDVAHNPHAARALADNLRLSHMHTGKTIAVFAMLADKDIQGVVAAVKDEIDVWYVANIDHLRGARAADLAKIITTIMPDAKVLSFENANNAFQQAYIDASDSDKIIVFGSFFTVSSIMQYLSNHA